MRYRVLRPFRNIDGSFLKLNDSVECTDNRASVLRRNGIIGNIVEYAIKAAPAISESDDTEKAIDNKPKKRRGRRKKVL